MTELRDFVIGALDHHHVSEDDLLWPMIIASAPELTDTLADLSAEHEQLESALETLEAVPIEGDADRTALRDAAASVRDLVHRHLEREEPLLLPALRAHVSEEAWASFSRQVIATAPPESAALMVGFLDQVGTSDEVELVLANLPEPAREMLPAVREHAHATLDALQTQTY
jgi:iron-sulfur cluster repair protein YtfE (RIC family)